nr:hypothetical protein [Tanacetum cinerariifolium]
MHYVLAKYGNKNGREDESLIDIIGDDIWKTFFNQVWNKFLDVAVVVVREQAKESSKRDVQDVGKTKVSKLVATKVFEVDKDVPRSSKREVQDVRKTKVLEFDRGY